MTQPDPPTLDYATPMGRKRGIGIAPFIVGPIAGAATYLAGILAGVPTMIIVAPIFGGIVGFICANEAIPCPFRASIAGNVMALVGILAAPLALAALTGARGMTPYGNVAWAVLMAFALLFAALFILPGLLAGWCVWRRERGGKNKLDADKVAKIESME